MKTCTQCQELKSVDMFFKDRAFKDGYYSRCKDCKNKKIIQWRQNNREKYNQAMRKYNAKHYKILRLQRYKITPEQYNQMMQIQKGCCAICNKVPEGKRPLAIDHNHHTGKVRSLLCYGCNRALHVLENKDLLSKATAYLSIHEQS